LNDWFSAAFLCSPLLGQLRSGSKWLVRLASIRFLCCVSPLLQCHFLGIYFAYMTLSSSSRYILVRMEMQWLECVIAIVGNMEWNTFVLSVTINHLAYFGTAAAKYGVFCVLRCRGCQIVLD
jgi:hypothetical protein